MIWTINDISGLLAAVIPAGEPDQTAIDAYLARTQRHLQPQQRPGVKRYYYLWQEDQRVTFCTVGMPLDSWRGAAWAMVGTREIIGEFPGNAHLAGKKGLQLKLQPLTWMKEPPDLILDDATHLVRAISVQILDLAAAQRSQERIAQKYQWKDERRS